MVTRRDQTLSKLLTFGSASVEIHLRINIASYSTVDMECSNLNSSLIPLSIKDSCSSRVTQTFAKQLCASWIQDILYGVYVSNACVTPILFYQVMSVYKLDSLKDEYGFWVRDVGWKKFVRRNWRNVVRIRDNFEGWDTLHTSHENCLSCCRQKLAWTKRGIF